MYRIIATHDTIGNDREYLTDSTTEPISDETVETLDECVNRLHEIAAEGKANSIEVIYPCTSYSNWHTSFYTDDHPFAEVELLFSEIDQWAEERRHPTLPHTDHLQVDTAAIVAHALEDNDDLPFYAHKTIIVFHRFYFFLREQSYKKCSIYTNIFAF